MILLHQTIKYGLLSIFLGAVLFACAPEARHSVGIFTDQGGSQLRIDGEPFFVKGMNWHHIPIGQTYRFSLWNEADSSIEAVLHQHMSLLQAAGVNTIRQYVGIPPRWIRHIYETYGIHTALNHPFARYGYQIDGKWIATVDYADPRLATLLLAEIDEMLEQYANTPGLLVWFLGNENNYGLHWHSAETADKPDADTQSNQAAALYRLMEKATQRIQRRDPHHPVGLVNGDLQYLELIATQCPSLDFIGLNVYRGKSFGDLFTTVQTQLNKPLLLAEFGADAFNALKHKEDQHTQAAYLLENWYEVYEHAYQQGKTGNCLGGFTFQFSDGWWKYNQETNLAIHDSTASWSNGGYTEDYLRGSNNMNEEWFGVCAKLPNSHTLTDSLIPRSSYKILAKLQELDPFDPQTTPENLSQHFIEIRSTLHE